MTEEDFYPLMDTLSALIPHMRENVAYFEPPQESEASPEYRDLYAALLRRHKDVEQAYEQFWELLDKL